MSSFFNPPYADNPTWINLDHIPAWDTHPEGYPLLEDVCWRQVPCLRDKSILPRYMKRKKYCLIYVQYQSEDGLSRVRVSSRNIPEDVYHYLRLNHFPNI